MSTTARPPDTEGLHAIPVTDIDRHDRVLDVVFVHGLGGNSHGTWRYGKEGNDDHFFWPEELAKDFPQCAFWSLGYAADISKATGRGMIIGLRAMSIASVLIAEGIGLTRPVVFITHSMGGLVTKAMVDGCRQNTESDFEMLISNIKGIIFCGTPHSGAAFANAAAILGKVIGGVTDWVNEMKKDTDGIELLHGRFLGWHKHNPVNLLGIAEREISFRTFLGVFVQFGHVVPSASARLAEEPLHQHPTGDHLALVKPKDFSDVTYGTVRRFLENLIEKLSTEA